MKLKQKSYFKLEVKTIIQSKNLKILLNIGHINNYIKYSLLKYDILIILQKYGLQISKGLRRYILLNLK